MKTSRPHNTPQNQIANIRRARRWSQYDLERETGISQARLSLLERSIRPMSGADERTIADALGVTSEQLFESEFIFRNN